MQKLTRESLYTLEDYARARPEFRRRVMEHKRHRKVPLGPNATLYFEDTLTIQYQVQEVLRVERLFEPAEVQDELDAYNPLIPDASNWKAVFMIEFSDEAERRQALARLIGIEDRVWLQVHGFAPVYAIADEDLDRETAEKTSAVHFVRFELAPDMIAAVRRGANIAAGVDHPGYRYELPALAPDVRQSLANDLP